MTCEYCHEDRDGYIVPIEKNCHAYIVYPDKLILKFDREYLECKINYCPMCGRKLKPGKSPCYSCANKNVYEPLLKCFVCNYSGTECNNRDFPMYRQKVCNISEPLKEEGMIDLIGDGKQREEVCKHAPPEKGKWPCEDCDMRWHDRAEPPKEDE